MTLLETITKAAADFPGSASGFDYPIVLNSEPALSALKPENDTPLDDALVKRADGWKISETDTEVIELSKKFFQQLKKKMKKKKVFSKDGFLDIFSSYLSSLGEKNGVSPDPGTSGVMRCCKLVEKVGSLIGRDVRGLVVEACAVLDLWDVLESLLVNGLVEASSQSVLINNLLEKRRSDLIIFCVVHFTDLQTYCILCILKYFLCPPKGAFESMFNVKKEWDNQALFTLEKVSSNSVSATRMNVAKDASLWLMLAHDGFSMPELCLHHLFASKNLDEVILGSCISKLNGAEMMSLIRYLSKWLRKYERFPQVVPCPKASLVLGLKACDWIPSLEVIVMCLGLVVDTRFSSLVMHSEFHEELRSLGEVADSLAAEARFCGSIACLVEQLKAAC